MSESSQLPPSPAQPSTLVTSDQEKQTRALELRSKLWEVRGKACEVPVKLFGIVSVLVAGVWGYVDYRTHEKARIGEEGKQRQERLDKEEELAKQRWDDAKKDRDIRDKEYRLAVYQERKPLYAQACRVAAQIATAEKLGDAKDAIQRFNELYYGELCLVEDKPMEHAMVAFRTTLEEHLQSPGKQPVELRRAAIKLAMSAQSGLKLEEVFAIVPGDQKSKLESEVSSGTAHSVPGSGDEKLKARDEKLQKSGAEKLKARDEQPKSK